MNSVRSNNLSLSTNKYFKFVGLKIDEFLNLDYQIEHVSNKIASLLQKNNTLSAVAGNLK